MATWDGWTILDGWRVAHGPDGYTLTAQFFAKTRDHAPIRSSAVPRFGINAVPAGFAAYKVSNVEIAPVSSVGPYVIQVTAKAGLGSSGVGNTGDHSAPSTWRRRLPASASPGRAWTKRLS